MYHVYADDQILCASSIPDREYHIAKPILKEDIGKVATFSFSIYPSHPLYDQIEQMSTTITVWKDNKIRFRGRILDIDKGMWLEKQCTCESALSYMNDTWIDELPETVETITAFFMRCINAHNDTCTEGRELEVGIIDIPERNQLRTFKIDAPSNVLDVLDSTLISEFGGYLRVRYTQEKTYVDYILKYNHPTSQKIQFAINLNEIDEEREGSNLFSIFCPTGKDNLKITSAVTTSEETLENGTVIKMETGFPMIIIPSAVERYGLIYRNQNFSDADTAQKVLSEAKKWLRNNYREMPAKITVKAIDLSLIGQANEEIAVGDTVNIISQPHGISGDYICQTVSTDIENPANTDYSFGDAEQTSSGIGSSGSASISSATYEERKVINEVVQHNRETESHLDVIDSNLSILRSNVAIHDSDISILKSNVAIHDSDISILKSNVAIHDSDISILKSNVAVHDSDISILKSNVAVQDSNISALRSNIQTIDSNISELRSNIQTIDSNISALRSNINVIDSNISVINSNITAIDGTLYSLSARIGTIEADYITTENLQASIAGLGEVRTQMLKTNNLLIGGFGGDSTNFLKNVTLTDNGDGTYTLTVTKLTGASTDYPFNKAALVSGSWSGLTYTAVPSLTGSSSVSTSLTLSVDNGTSANVNVHLYHETPSTANELASKVLTMTEDVSNQRVVIKEGTTEKGRVSTSDTYNAGYAGAHLSGSWNNHEYTVTKVATGSTDSLTLTVTAAASLSYSTSTHKYTATASAKVNGTERNTGTAVSGTEAYDAGYVSGSAAGYTSAKVSGSWNGGTYTATKGTSGSDSVSITLTAGITYDSSTHKYTAYCKTGSTIRGSGTTGGTEAYDAGYKAGWNACIDACTKYENALTGYTSTSYALFTGSEKYIHMTSPSDQWCWILYPYSWWSEDGGYKGGTKRTLYSIPAKK